MITWGKFSPKAIDFLTNSNARLNILHGSVRSSKTVNVDVRWLTYLLDGPPGDLFMVGKTIATLQRNVLNDILDILGPGNYHWVNRQQGEIYLLHRRVYLVGACTEEAETKIRGATIAGALCDEANLYPQSFWDMLMSRLSVAGAECFATLNPDSPYHWFYVNVLNNDAITNKKVWHFTLEDNLNLDPEFISSLKQMYTGVFYRRFILGEWCIAEGAIYDMFSESKNVMVLPADTKVQKYIVSCDYGTSTVMSWSMIARLGLNRYHKVKEYYYNAEVNKAQKTDSEFCAEFIKWLGSIRPSVVYCDPSAASWKVELRKKGYNVQDADNDVLNGIRVVASLLEDAGYTIDPGCLHTLKEYPSYSWDPKAQKIGIDKPVKINDHACDSDRYGVYTDSKFAMSGVY
jgi:PBSX family phage terminase large subunit